ncbi:hypothetical protein B0J11DRAFT_26511 [Dendryphion nanum]|uniref:GMC oxidoreductase n=1 Tax=Dendryphion nanum TaxID=256645 RepID=A0A9P9EKN6_9PLEO|nr:hypothetical protein B0J11DRAFT_26511 [Dendryphion nanum]
MADSKFFDYVIVGGGTAGLVLANRLSEDINVSVAVIEAGGDATSDPRSMTPAFWSMTINSELDWAFATTKQDGLNGRRIGHSQGKMLGGTSSMNAQALIPPSAFDLNAWGELGNSEWSWEFATHLSKLFTLQFPDDETSKHYNTAWAKDFADEGNGNVKASFTGLKDNPFSKIWIETFDNLGYPLTASPFSGHSTGAYSCPSTVDHVTKTRSTSATAYYLPIASRPNLKVFDHAIAGKIVLEQDEATKETRAIAVAFSKDDSEQIIKAKREIILSAGVFNTPKLLELSGIGNPEILHAHGIDAKVENVYVGTNLQDHLVGGISFEVVDGVKTGDSMMRQDPEELKQAMELWQKREGPLGSPGITSVAYLPTVDFATDKEARAQALTRLENTEVNHPLDTARIKLARNLIERGDEGTAQYLIFPAQTRKAGKDTVGVFAPGLEPENYVTICASLSHPLSTGTVHISSSDVAEPPIIDHRYLSNNFDLDVFGRHYRYIETIAATEPFSTVLKPGGKRNDPRSVFNGDLEKAKEYARIASSTHWHSVGTCAMAPKEKGGVVDEKFRVYGVKGLRIVDASVFPLVPQSNTQTLVYSVAEKASELIKGDVLE